MEFFRKIKIAVLIALLPAMLALIGNASWVYGPLNPRTIYFGIKLGNLL